MGGLKGERRLKSPVLDIKDTEILIKGDPEDMITERISKYRSAVL
jgi:hypothetical protein